MQHCLNFLPERQGHLVFRPTFGIGVGWGSAGLHKTQFPESLLIPETYFFRSLLVHAVHTASAQGNRRLGLKLDLLGNACFATPFRILTPGFRQIQPPGDGKTPIPRAYRQTYCRLTIIVFADLTAVLASHPTECFRNSSGGWSGFKQRRGSQRLAV